MAIKTTGDWTLLFLEHLRKSGFEELVRGIEASVAWGAVGLPSRGGGVLARIVIDEVARKCSAGCHRNTSLSALDVPVMFAGCEKLSTATKSGGCTDSGEEIPSQGLADIERGNRCGVVSREIHFLERSLEYGYRRCRSSRRSMTLKLQLATCSISADIPAAPATE